MIWPELGRAECSKKAGSKDCHEVSSESKDFGGIGPEAIPVTF